MLELKLKKFRHLLQIPNTPLATSIDWPPIGISPNNEYNTEGLLSMAFPTMFPIDAAMVTQPRIHQVEMHTYALHLIHYHDNRFEKHPLFRYYIYNVIMHHRSNATASVFVKINLEDTLPPTILELVDQLQDMPNEKIGERVA